MQAQRPGAALIVGGASGIGEAMFQYLQTQQVPSTVADLQASSGQLCCDIRDVEQVDALRQQALTRHPDLDTLIITAGVGLYQDFDQASPQDLRQVIDTNLLGPLNVIRALLPDLQQAADARVVVLGSIAAHQPFVGGSAYCASKAGLEMLIEVLRQEQAGRVSFTTISPGVVDTPFFRDELSGPRDPHELGTGTLTAQAVVDAIWFALTCPRETAINRLELRPREQQW